MKISHAGYLWTVRQRTASTDYGGHCFLVAAPLYHMNALNTIKLALAGQGRLVLMPQFSPAGYLDAIERYRCTWLTAIPTMIALLARETGALAGADLASVAMVRLGSEPLTQRIADSARAMFRARRSATATARPRPARWCSARIRKDWRNPCCRLVIRTRRCSCGWPMAQTSTPPPACCRSARRR